MCSRIQLSVVKHILGQANTGGGYIVIGFQEDRNGKLLADPALTEDVSRSYETTRLSQSVDSFLSPGQRIELQVHKVPFDGRICPVISVQAFNESPYFCGKEFLGAATKPILREGTIYVRDVAAKTVVIAGPEHWNLILKTAVTQRQTELLEHLRSLLGQLGISISGATPTVNPAVAKNQEWFESESKEDLLKPW
jgi:predicted HTH transcriptional regulator